MLVYWLDIVGTAVFAISGVLLAGKLRMDPFGVLVLGVVTAVGGGTIRDMALDHGPVFWVKDPTDLVVAMVTSMLTIVLALASRAPITFMDEPVAGLDVVAREDFYRLLLDDYAETGRTFVISTHILEEASNVFEKVLIMKEGRLIEACDADELLAQFCAVTGRDDVVNEACAGLNILHTETLGRQKSCVVRVPAETMAAKELDVDCTSLPLQKVFVALCGHEQELQEHREG